MFGGTPAEFSREPVVGALSNAPEIAHSLHPRKILFL